MNWLSAVPGRLTVRSVVFRRGQKIFQFEEEIISQNLALVVHIQAKAVDQVSQNKPYLSISFKQAYSICRFLPLQAQACQRGNDPSVRVGLSGYSLQHGFSY